MGRAAAPSILVERSARAPLIWGLLQPVSLFSFAPAPGFAFTVAYSGRSRSRKPDPGVCSLATPGNWPAQRSQWRRCALLHEGDVLWWPIFAPRLAPWCYAQALSLQFVNADVGQITSRPHSRRQARQYARLFERLISDCGPGTLSAMSLISPVSSFTLIWLFNLFCFSVATSLYHRSRSSRPLGGRPALAPPITMG
jgi:hypothetical protein